MIRKTLNKTDSSLKLSPTNYQRLLLLVYWNFSCIQRSKISQWRGSWVADITLTCNWQLLPTYNWTFFVIYLAFVTTQKANSVDVIISSKEKIS